MVDGRCVGDCGGNLIGGKQIINMQVFSMGYIAAFFAINQNKSLLNKLLTGSRIPEESSPYGHFTFCLNGHPMTLFATENWRLIWLGALMATALHFFPSISCMASP